MVDGPLGQPPQPPTFFAAFDHLLETCRRTRSALVAIVHDGGDDAIRDVLASETLTHVEAVLDGLLVVARTGQFTHEELRALVGRAGILPPPHPGSPDARAATEEAAHARPRLRPVDGRMMLAAGHARVVFSLIPRLPTEAVGWPRAPRTYADIPVPRTQAELMLRAEELVRVVWRTASGDARPDEPFRRTLAFYEAGARLSFRGFQAA